MNFFIKKEFNGKIQAKNIDDYLEMHDDMRKQKKSGQENKIKQYMSAVNRYEDDRQLEGKELYGQQER